jgi:hypothetical protein
MYTTHMIIGGAGCDEMSPGSGDGVDGDLSGINWLAASSANYGMGILNVVNDTQLVWQWFESTNGTVVDEIVITKPAVN